MTQFRGSWTALDDGVTRQSGGRARGKRSKMRPLVLAAALCSLAVLLVVSLVLYLFVWGGQGQVSSLKINETCKFENFLGTCKSEDSCLWNRTSIKLNPCNKGDPSLVCCPLQEGDKAPINLLKADNNNLNNNGAKRSPGTKANEMCKEYGKSSYRWIENPAFFGEKYIKVIDCNIEEKLIKNGVNASNYEFPHMVQIGIFNETSGMIEWVCGGSLVSPDYILSAAHCNITEGLGYAMFGTNVVDITDDFYENHTAPIIKIHIHPNYNPANNFNDIALYKIGRSVEDRPICLDTENSPSIGMSVTATGFGIEKNETSSGVLQKVSFRIVDSGPCATKYQALPIPRSVPEYSFCAFSEGKDTCRGDSGGPVQIRHKNKELPCMFTLVGITSFGIKCRKNTNIPGVYTKVYPYVGWIEDIVWPQ